MPVKLARRRYLAFKVSSAHIFSKRDLYNEVTQKMLNVFNKSETGEGITQVILYDQLAGLGIIRCGHKSVDKVKLVLKNLRTISGKPVTIDVTGVSGTIRALKRKYVLG
jgi:RNase P/RNase MRP subunit POP5